MELNKYTELVITNGADFRKLFLNRIELLDLVTIEFGVQFEGDFDNKSFYTRPFLYNEEKDQYILFKCRLTSNSHCILDYLFGKKIWHI